MPTKWPRAYLTGNAAQLLLQCVYTEKLQVFQRLELEVRFRNCKVKNKSCHKCEATNKAAVRKAKQSAGSKLRSLLATAEGMTLSITDLGKALSAGQVCSHDASSTAFQ